MKNLLERLEDIKAIVPEKYKEKITKCISSLSYKVLRKYKR